jgi:hypothetical protein
MLAFAPDTRPPMITIPELVLVLALVAALVALIVGGTHLWKHHAHSRG